MLLALLYESDGQLSAAAPACDQQPLGNRFWLEGCPERVNLRGSETAYADIEHPELLDWLLKMQFRDGFDAARAVEAYLGLSTSSHPGS